MPNPALLLLCDGRLPAGGYAHSSGLEASVAAGQVVDTASLASFLRGRAVTAGATAAAFAAAACHATRIGDAVRSRSLEPELDARLPSPALRAVSRQLGRQLLLVVRRMRPDPRLEQLGRSPHQPIVLGAAGAAFALSPHDAATAVLYDSVAGPATAAVRLLSLDPFEVHTALADLLPLLDTLAADAATHIDDAPGDLPSAAAPMLDVAAEHHARAQGRLFAS